LALGLAIGVSWWYFDLGHDFIERLPWLHGQPIGIVVRELGQPDRQLEYAMKESPGGEFRIELYNTYPPDDPIAQETHILELQWHRTRYDIAVWLHQINGEWRVLDTCRWKASVNF
jgi:hypothetical protein